MSFAHAYIFNFVITMAAMILLHAGVEFHPTKRQVLNLACIFCFLVVITFELSVRGDLLVTW